MIGGRCRCGVGIPFALFTSFRRGGSHGLLYYVCLIQHTSTISFAVHSSQSGIISEI